MARSCVQANLDISKRKSVRRTKERQLSSPLKYLVQKNGNVIQEAEIVLKYTVEDPEENKSK